MIRCIEDKLSLLSKQVVVLVLLLACKQIVFAQYDNAWLLNYSILDFSSGSPIEIGGTQSKHQIIIHRSCITTPDGSNRFQTDGRFLENKFFDTLLGKQLPHDPVFTDLSRNITQGSFFLPSVDRNIYHFFYAKPQNNACNIGICGDFMKIYHYTIDASLNQNRGEVIGVDSILDDTLAAHRFTACKHANGRDWWMLLHRENSDYYYKVLFSNNKLTADTQVIGSHFSHGDGIGGLATFSRNGTLYAVNAPIGIDTTLIYGTDLFDFDRCTGRLSNHRQIVTPFRQANLGCAFSPDNRFLYINTYNFLYQYDIAEDTLLMIDSSSHFAFLKMALAPDNKIYLCRNGSAGMYLGVIANPNNMGTACNFNADGFALGAANVDLPNFPYYYLGALEGSECDTLISGIEHQESRTKAINAYPNPAIEAVTIDYGNIIWEQYREVKLQVVNTIGQVVYSSILPRYSGIHKVNVSSLPAGIYHVEVYGNSKLIGVSKVVKE